MKKVLLSAVALFAFGFAAKAQDSEGGFKLGLHAGIPMGDIKDYYSFNFGVDVAYMFPVADSFKLGIASGYDAYPGKTVDFSDGAGGTISVKSDTAAFIPVAGSAQYSITENFFLGADLGYAVYVGAGDGNGGFYYQPKVGYQMEKIEVYVDYKGISVDGGTFSSVGIGANYKF